MSSKAIRMKYAPGSAEHPYVEHGFFTTVSLIRTMEALLGLPPMNHNDAYAPIMSSWAGRTNTTSMTKTQTPRNAPIS